MNGSGEKKLSCWTSSWIEFGQFRNHLCKFNNNTILRQNWFVFFIALIELTAATHYDDIILTVNELTTHYFEEVKKREVTTRYHKKCDEKKEAPCSTFVNQMSFIIFDLFSIKIDLCFVPLSPQHFRSEKKKSNFQIHTDVCRIKLSFLFISFCFVLFSLHC